MESNNNKNNHNNDGGDKHQQLQGSAQNCKSNKLASDEDKPAAAATGEDQKCSSNKNLEEGSDLDLEVESLSREELIKMVLKQMAAIKEAQKHFETAKKAEESASRQAEEFSQRNIQLEQEKAELQEDLHQKMAEIVEMHKEVEEKSEELAEKAKQIDALLTQLNESTSHQHQLGLPVPIPTEQEMKIQLPLENWFDLLALVPRSQLGQIVPQIGDRRFARIIQAFLHEHGEITLGKMVIIRPRRNVPSDRPMVKGWPLPDWPMPGNVKNFEAVDFNYCYMDMFVLDFLRKLQQNSLLANVNLHFKYHLTEDVLLRILAQILPFIDSINSINSFGIDLLKMAYKNNNSNNDDDEREDDEQS